MSASVIQLRRNPLLRSVKVRAVAAACNGPACLGWLVATAVGESQESHRAVEVMESLASDSPTLPSAAERWLRAIVDRRRRADSNTRAWALLLLAMFPQC